MFVSALGAVIKRDVLRGLIELQAAGCREALDESELASELMRKLMSLKHGLCMGTGGRGEAGVEYECWRTGSQARLVGQLKQILFHLEFMFHVRNIGSAGGGVLQGGAMSGLPRAIGGSQVHRRRQGHHPCADRQCE